MNMLNEIFKIIGIVTLFVLSCAIITKIGYNFGITAKVRPKKRHRTRYQVRRKKTAR